MKNFPDSLIKTWVFKAQATDPKLANAKQEACDQLIKLFGSVELAIIYLEQTKDKTIEVVLV